MKHEVLQGDVLDRLRELPGESVHCCVTSPPYWGLRDYGVDGQIGLEPTPAAYVTRMVEVFREVRRVLRGDGTLWLNIGDAYWGGGRGGNPEESSFRKQATNAGSLVDATNWSQMDCGIKPKDLVGLPWLLAFALRDDGWYLRSDIIWSKPNPMPESVTDRPTKAHEYLFLLAKSQRYYYDAEAVKEPLIKGDAGSAFDSERKLAIHPNIGRRRMPPISGAKHAGTNGNATYSGEERDWLDGRNRRTVWQIATQPYPEAHFATYPEALVEPCIKAGCPEGGTVLDPFLGSGTTLAVAAKLGRSGIGIELNPAYVALAEKRIGKAKNPHTWRDTKQTDAASLFHQTPGAAE